MEMAREREVLWARTERPEDYCFRAADSVGLGGFCRYSADWGGSEGDVPGDGRRAQLRPKRRRARGGASAAVKSRSHGRTLGFRLPFGGIRSPQS